MPRLLISSKYCVLRTDGAVAFFLSKVYAMLTPSIGLCLMPLTVCGALTPVASRIVGTISRLPVSRRHKRSTASSRDTGSLEDRRHDIDDMVELRADAAGIIDVAGPRDR